MVSFMLWLLYPQGRNPWYILDRRLGVPQSHSRVVVKRKIPSPCRDLQLRFIKYLCDIGVFLPS
jgi:hypothetical protein